MGFDIEIVKRGGIYTACRYIQWEIAIENTKLTSCTVLNENNNRPYSNYTNSSTVLFDNLTSDVKFNEDFFNKIYEAKLEFIRKMNDGDECVCKGCHSLQTKEWEPMPKLRLNRFSFSPDETCNASCIYCTSNHTSPRADYSVVDLVNSAINFGYIDVNDIYYCCWGGGEPTIMKGFEELFDTLKNTKLTNLVATTGIVFSEIVAKQLEIGHPTTYINISLDSGDANTYKTVKRVDRFDKVVDSFDKYYKRAKIKSNLFLKYIVLPENCSFEQIDNFIDLIKSKGWYGITVFISCNIRSSNITDDVIAGINYLSLKVPLVTGVKIQSFVFDWIKDFDKKFETDKMAKFGQIEHFAQENGFSLDEVIEFIKNNKK